MGIPRTFIGILGPPIFGKLPDEGLGSGLQA